MRTAIFTDTYLPDINGVVSSCVTLKKALESLGHEVFVVTNHKGTGIVREDHVLRLPGLEVKRLYGYKVSAPLNFSALEDIEKMNLDVIHLQTEYGVGLYGVQLAKALKIPLVYTNHTLWEDYTHYINPLDISGVETVSRAAIRNLVRKFSNGMQAVIAPSEKSKAILETYGVVAGIHVVPTGLDLSRFHNLDRQKAKQMREELGLAGKKVALFVGRLAKEKNLEMVMEAIDHMEDEDIRLLVVGSGPDAGHFHNIQARAAHPERFVFTGQVESKEVPLYYGVADCFVSASTTETQGMTYIEALASGLPVLGRRDPVLDDLLEEGKTGYRFDDAAELEQKLARFFKEGTCNPALCLQKAEPYTEENFGKKVEAVYEEAITLYKDTYKVEKMHLQDDFVLLSLVKKNDKEMLKINIPIDDFFELKLGMQDTIPAPLVRSYLELQDYYLVYMAAKRRVADRDYTAGQLKQWATFNKGLEPAQADRLVEEFVEKHLVDDRQYAFDKAAYWHDTGHSRSTIKNKLFKAGISPDLIEEALAELDEDREYANAKDLAKRLVQTVKEQSSRMKRQTIIKKLRAKGYSMEVARRAGEELELEETDDRQALESALKKAIRLYDSLDGEKRNQKIEQYVLRKGFSRSELEELDWKELPDAD